MGVQNQKGFCLRINILKGNYLILRIGLVGTSEVFKNQSLMKFEQMADKILMRFDIIVSFFVNL